MSHPAGSRTRNGPLAVCESEELSDITFIWLMSRLTRLQGIAEMVTFGPIGDLNG